MKVSASLISALAFALLLGSSSAGWGAPQAGKDYLVINPPQPTETGKKIEVLEVFSYACPHCYALEPKLTAWVRQLPGDVAFRRMPAVFRESWAPLAKAYYALEAMGELERVHEKIFRAIHEDNIALSNQDALFDWAEKQGIDRKKFVDTYSSFGVQSKVQRAIAKAREYGVSGVPSLIVDGKFLTSSSLTGSHENLFPVLDQLIKDGRAAHTAKK
jgi:protein dithiol oxidoreductase (disulfide-forming)